MYYNKHIFIIIFILAFTSTNLAQSYMSARSVALSGAFSTNSRGINTIGWNPANLGYKDNPGFSYKFFVLPFVPAPSFEIKNNSITPHWYNNDFLIGEELDSEQKSELISHFPETGMRISPIVNIDILSISAGRWAFSLSAESISNITIPKSFFNFVFYGNEFNKPIDLSNTDIESQNIASFTVYHGRELMLPNLDHYLQNLNIGFGIKFLFGAGYLKMQNMDAKINFKRDQAIINGNTSLLSAGGGYGLAFDIGASAQFTDKTYASLSLHNLGGQINWGKHNSSIFKGSFLDNNDKEGNIIERVFKIKSNIHKRNFENLDSLFNEGITTDTSYALDNYNSTYPAYMNFGFEYKLDDNLKLLTNYQQFFNEQLVFNTTPRLSIATEYYPFSVLPLRGGFSIGGFDGFRWSFGSGLNFDNYTLDFGFSQIGGIFNKARGFNFTITNMLLF